ncbi:MAG: nucleotidyltransferase family protein [Burkholderiales bacterium]
MIQDWHRFAVLPQAPLIDALRVIDKEAQQFALVVADGRLLGLVTDGDIRRALVRGLGTDARIEEAMNVSPILGTLAEGPAGWRLKLRRHQIRHLPVVDDLRQMQHLVTDQSGRAVRDNWTVLMAGGLGTRLRPITETIPKPMIDVGGRPILETIVDTLAHYGFRKLFLSVNYRADVIESHFRDGSAYGMEIQYLRETTQLGTAGALAMLPQIPISPILVMNGDVLTGLDFGGFLDDHIQESASITVGVREHVSQIPYGVMDVEGDRVLGIREKPEIRSTVSAGIYALSPEVLPLVPGGLFFDMPTLILKSIEADQRVRAHMIDDYWIDVGRLDDLERARLKFEQGAGP